MAALASSGGVDKATATAASSGCVLVVPEATTVTRAWDALLLARITLMPSDREGVRTLQQGAPVLANNSAYWRAYRNT